MKTKILIVDDIQQNIAALKGLLSGEDLDILSATDADQALNLVFEHEFALALLDVHMPSMSGFELARLIRGVERSRHLPIIFVTAMDRGGSIEFEGYDTGAVDVLYKPLDRHVVRSKVRVFAKLNEQSKELQEQIRIASQLREQAEAANVAKGRFLANMSHEIRTPLGAVLGFAELLGTSDVNGSERERLCESIHRNGILLKRVIDDVLDLSKIEAQKLELEFGPFNLIDMIHDLELTLGHRAREKGVDFKIEVGPGLEGRFISDSTRVKQVLLNVIGNAVKFTEHGIVHVEVRKEKEENPDSIRVGFKISDTGIGLSPEQQRRLFEPFSQGDASTSKKFGGTGLGLVIARHLARLLGGDVELKQCKRGEGCVFQVNFLMKPTDVPKEKQKAASKSNNANLRDKRILVVDDLIDNRELMELYLQNTGAAVELAESGEAALSRLRADDEVDIVLMDVQMPGMDGYATTRALRKEGFNGPIVALTAHAMRSEIQRCFEAGCDSVLTKPISRAELIQQISASLQN